MSNHNDHTEKRAPAPHGATPAVKDDEKTYWLDQPANIRKIYYGLWTVCILLVGADLFYEKHVEFPIEGLFGFFGFYGFLSCVSLVYAAKLLRKVVMRPEDYYDK